MIKKGNINPGLLSFSSVVLNPGKVKQSPLGDCRKQVVLSELAGSLCLHVNQRSSTFVPLSFFHVGGGAPT